METMKAARFMGEKTFAVEDMELPRPGAGEVLIRNRVCGICGTDVHIYHGEPGSADVHPPIILGHEYSGEVVQVGEGVQTLKPGDHVTVDPNIYCGQCVHCRSGKKQMCTDMQAIGVTRNGGFAQYSVVPQQQAFLLEPQVSFEAGAMAEPVACCIHGIDLLDIRTGETVVIVGGGAIGLILLQLVKLSGACAAVVSEPNEMRRQAALALGADVVINPAQPGAAEAFQAKYGGADKVIECAGNSKAVESAFAYAGKGATILLFSVPQVDAVFPVPLFEIFKKELTIKGSFVNPDTHLRAVRLINSGKLSFAPIITHRFPVEQTEDAIFMQMDSSSIKVVVSME